MPEKDLRLPLLEHLEEIRKRVFVVLIVFVIFSMAGFYFSESLLQWLKIPGGPYLGALSVFSPTSALFTFFKMAFFFGLIFSLPVLLYEVWMFIRPTVEESLAWYGAFLIFSGTGLFVAGALNFILTAQTMIRRWKTAVVGSVVFRFCHPSAGCL